MRSSTCCPGASTTISPPLLPCHPPLSVRTSAESSRYLVQPHSDNWKQAALRRIRCPGIFQCQAEMTRAVHQRLAAESRPLQERESMERQMGTCPCRGDSRPKGPRQEVAQGNLPPAAATEVCREACHMYWHLQACAVLATYRTADQEGKTCSAVQVKQWEPPDTQHQLKSKTACPRIGHIVPRQAGPRNRKTQTAEKL